MTEADPHRAELALAAGFPSIAANYFGRKHEKEAALARDANAAHLERVRRGCPVPD